MAAAVLVDLLVAHPELLQIRLEVMVVALVEAAVALVNVLRTVEEVLALVVQFVLLPPEILVHSHRLVSVHQVQQEDRLFLVSPERTLGLPLQLLLLFLLLWLAVVAQALAVILGQTPRRVAAAAL